MTPGKYNIPAQRRCNTFLGHSFTITVNGDPVDFTDASINMQVRKSPIDPVVLEWKTSDNSLTIDNNTITMGEKTGTQMDIEPGIYVYDMLAVLGDGVANTYVEGTFTITPTVTRTT